MYYAIVALLMFLLPALSVVIEIAQSSPLPLVLLIGKWYVFWAVGARLGLAGLRQIIQPRYTAEVILGLKSEESLLLVRELGFSNVALGLAGLISLWKPEWRGAVALTAGIFYALAGINHARQAHRNRLENVAMVSDLIAGLVLLGFCVQTFLG